MAVGTKHYTVAAFEKVLADPANHERLLELIDGEIVEKMPTEQHASIAAWIATFFNLYLLENPTFKGITSVEARHELDDDDENSRIPDVSFIKGDREPVSEGSIKRMPDIAVEVKSPKDNDKKLTAKAKYYIANGCQIVWVVKPAEAIVQVYRPNTPMVTLTIEDTLDGGDIMPNFALPIHRFLRRR